MKSTIEQRLMRLSHGELPAEEARQLKRQLSEDPELQAAYQRLSETWNSLSLPEPRNTPTDFAPTVIAAARTLAVSDLNWSLAPTWARFGATAALATGITLGTFFGNLHPTVPTAADLDLFAEAESTPLSLAEVYWISLEDSGSLQDGGSPQDGPNLSPSTIENEGTLR